MAIMQRADLGLPKRRYSHPTVPQPLPTDHSREFRHIGAAERSRILRLSRIGTYRRILDAKQEASWSKGNVTRSPGFYSQRASESTTRSSEVGGGDNESSSAGASSLNFERVGRMSREEFMQSVRDPWWRKLCEMPSAMWVRRSGQTGGEVPSTSATGATPLRKV